MNRPSLQAAKLCLDDTHDEIVITTKQLALLRDCGGAGGNRTHDILLAKQALSHLSYSPVTYAADFGGPGKT